ncbi:MAG: 50S ribosomal protein L11 methyltransferase [Rickettsiaceae bacterium]|nr:50S ribosomal protein L11 methyltransferase [Rickettsiaceae bacterium]
MQEKIDTNPFKSHSYLYKVSFQAKFKDIEMLDLIFEDIAEAISSCEISSDTVESKPEDLWYYSSFFTEMPDPSYLYSIAGRYIISEIEILEEKEKDWVTLVQKNMNPIVAGKFFVKSKTAQIETPKGLISLSIEAGRAFGTGEHETTSLCLELISGAVFEPEFVLDVGSGTGILSFAAKKLWNNARVVGIDIDPIAVQIAQENSKINNTQVEFFESKEMVQQYSNADLIIANILARPLIDMAHDFSLMLKRGGHIFVSGFLEYQKQDVINAYSLLGFKHTKELMRNGWIAIGLSSKPD